MTSGKQSVLVTTHRVSALIALTTIIVTDYRVPASDRRETSGKRRLREIFAIRSLHSGCRYFTPSLNLFQPVRFLFTVNRVLIANKIVINKSQPLVTLSFSRIRNFVKQGKKQRRNSFFLFFLKLFSLYLH